MKFKVFASVSLLSLLVLPLANAQLKLGLEGTIPFEFHVGATVLPAGKYLVRQSTGTPYILTLRGLDQTNAAIMFSSIPAQANSAQNPRLVFQRYGSSYFLSEVWPGLGQNAGFQLPRSKAERVIASQMAAAATPHNVELASVAFTVK